MGHGPSRPIALAIAATLAGLAAEPPKPQRDLAEASLEDLMNIEVTIASKRHQRLSQTPAAVFVITSEDIRRSGMSSVPDLLRMAPGVQVAQAGSGDWAVGARGFSETYSNKLLVLVDGRTVYSPVFSGVFWDEQDIPLDTVDRIEVIRGPGATMWGSNAVNGVINIITKPARESQGGMAKTGAGTGSQNLAEARYGGKLGARGHYRIAAKHLHGRALRDRDWRTGISGQSAMNLGFRADWALTARDSLTVKTDAFDSRSEVELVPTRVPADAPRKSVTRASGGNVMVNWVQTQSERSSTALQVYLTRPVRSDALHRAAYTTVDVDFHHEALVSESNALVWGFNFRDSAIDTTGTTHASFSRESRNLVLFSGFVQNAWTLVPDRLTLVAGTKLERNAFSGGEIQPAAHLLWTPDSRHTIWGGVSRAVRAPSMLETDFRGQTDRLQDAGGLAIIPRAFGNPNFLPETLLSTEMGYRLQEGGRLSLDIAAHYGLYRRLRSYETNAPYFALAPEPHIAVDSVFGNGLRGSSRGIEATATWRAAERWRLIPSYSWLRLDTKVQPGSSDIVSRGLVEGRSPRHQAQIRSLLDISSRLQFDASAFYTSALPNDAIRSYTRIDARLGYRVRQDFEIGVSGQNLQGGWHTEFISSGPFRPAQVGRSVMLTLTWGL